MAPPFSSEDEVMLEEDDGVGRNTGARGRRLRGDVQMPLTHPTTRTPHKLEENVLSNRLVLDQLLQTNTSSSSSKSKKDVEKDKKEAEEKKVRRIDPYGHPRNINRVTFEVPMIVQYPSLPTSSSKKAKKKSDNDDNSQQQHLPKLNLSQNVRCSMQCFVPPSTPDGRWTCSISGNSNVFSTVGSANGAADVTYKLSPSWRLVGGFKLLTTDSRPLQLHLGAHIKDHPKNQSSMQVSLQQQPKNHWAINMHTREVMDPWIITSNFGWNSKKPNEGKGMMWISSMTTHVVKLGMGWNLAPSDKSWWMPNSLMQVVLDPKLSSSRRLPVSFQYQPTKKTWNVSATLTTAKKKQKPNNKKSGKQQQPANGPSVIPASWRIGVQGGGSVALQFKWSLVVAWQQGDVTLRIPIMLGTAASLFQQPKQGQREQRSLAATVTPFAVIAIIGMANEMLSRFLWSGHDEDETKAAKDSKLEPTPAANNNKKAKADAAAQQRLMQRQAESRTANELEKNGLVIQSAVYEYGEASSWDVTIPLQFWVQNDTSTLRLAVGSKQHLLGFYPLSDDTVEEKDVASSLPREQRIPWWQEYWTPTAKRTKKATSSTDDPATRKPTLKVQYSFEGKDFEKEVNDDEALNLPEQM